MENKVIKTIKARTSTRKYLNKKVPLKKLEAVLEAGKYAPSAMNRQICSILAIRKGSLVKKFHELAKEVANRECYYGASTLILVYGPRGDKFTPVDGACMLENMFIAATSLGLGSCWINQTDDLFNTPQGAKLRKKIGLTEEDQIVGTCILGYRDGEPQTKPRREDLVKIL